MAKRSVLQHPPNMARMKERSSLMCQIQFHADASRSYGQRPFMARNIPVTFSWLRSSLDVQHNSETGPQDRSERSSYSSHTGDWPSSSSSTTTLTQSGQEPSDDLDWCKTSEKTRQGSSDTLVDEPYHIFSRGKKLRLICLVSFAALFSPLSSNIYFPALGAISRVGLTITSCTIMLTTFTGPGHLH